MNVNPTQMINQFYKVIAQKGINIPQDVMNNPDGIIQFLMNNRLITQEQYNWAAQIANKIPKK